MKSDISRQTFDPRKHYSRVVMQQGRVQMDADWNEQQDILLHCIETQTRDIIGKSGVPEKAGGFKIGFTPDDRDLWITPGRIYVDGILCEQEASVIPVWFDKASDRIRVENLAVDGRDFQRGQWIEMHAEDLHLDNVFQITHVDPTHKLLTLRTDRSVFTTSEFQKSFDLKIRRIITYATQPDYPHPKFINPAAELPELLLSKSDSLLLVYLKVWQRHITALDDPRMREVALGGPDTATRMQMIWQVELLPVSPTSRLDVMIKRDEELVQELNKLEGIKSTSHDSKTNQRIEEIKHELDTLERDLIRLFNAFSCDAPCSEWNSLVEPPTGMLTATVYPQDNSKGTGYLGEENQLYRVEIHKGASASQLARFKWARDNASVMALADMNGNVATLKSTTQGDINRFSIRQFVEPMTAQAEFHARPEELVKIVNVDSHTNQLQLETPLSSIGNGSAIPLRLWDGSGEILTSGQWIPLEEGIRLQFSEGTYRSGDYWLIPARSITHEIEWPPYQTPNKSPLPQPPQGVQRHYCRLARIQRYVTARKYSEVNVSDCRRRVNPLPEHIDAMHVVEINWQNDARYPDEFLEHKRLIIKLDAAPDPYTVNAATMMVTLQAAMSGGGEGVFIMHGVIEVQENTIIWHWQEEEEEGLLVWLFTHLDKVSHEIFATRKHSLCVRVMLKGHMIWREHNGHLIYLDGQTFGGPGTRSGRHRRIDLRFPSGAGTHASDFESWFYMKE